MSVPDTLKVGDYEVHTGLFINNEWVRGNGEAFETINPATEETIGMIQSASEADVDKAVACAREAFENTWGLNTPGQERGRLLYALADALAKSKDEISYLESVDAGKPRSWCKADNDDAVNCLRYYAGIADKLQGQYIPIEQGSKHAITVREPVGVCALVLPWNYPTAISAWKLGPALAAGCTIVFKMAETTPLATLKLAELIKEVGFPPGVFNVVNGLGHIVGNALSHHMDIDKISFTGSTVTGRKIAEAAAKSNLKTVTLELGGKSPNIVFKGANLQEAAKWSVLGVFENMGQSCTASSRTLVEKSVVEEFTKYYLEAVAAIKVGDPLADDTFSGPQNSKVQFDKIMDLIESGKQSARLLTGGERHGSRGYFIQPTVFTDVTMDMRIAQEEIFGPVSSIFTFDTEAEAIKIANNTAYGLAAAVHTLDANQINRVTAKLKAGTVWVNQYTMLSHAIPFGGYKQSGWGRELGLQGLDAYTTTKSVHYYYGEPLDWPIVL